MEYKILGAEADKYGVVDIPDDVMIIGALYHPVTGAVAVVCLQDYERWKEQNPTEARKEKKERTAAESESLVPPAPPAESPKESQEVSE